MQDEEREELYFTGSKEECPQNVTFGEHFPAPSYVSYAVLRHKSTELFFYIFDYFEIHITLENRS